MLIPMGWNYETAACMRSLEYPESSGVHGTKSCVLKTRRVLAPRGAFRRFRADSDAPQRAVGLA